MIIPLTEELKLQSLDEVYICCDTKGYLTSQSHLN